MSKVLCGNKVCRAEGVDVPPSGSTVAQHMAPGWIAVPDHMGGINYFCGSCAARLRSSAEEIVGIVGSDHLYFPALLPRKG